MNVITEYVAILKLYPKTDFVPHLEYEEVFSKKRHGSDVYGCVGWCLTPGEKIISIGGTNKGADTAIVVRSAFQENFFAAKKVNVLYC